MSAIQTLPNYPENELSGLTDCLIIDQVGPHALSNFETVLQLI
jgi:hypothetical protein